MKRSFTIAAGTLLVLLCLTPQSYAGEITVRGHLAPTVESGGWLIVTDKDKYLLLNAQTFQQEKWFRDGARVEATGETKPDKFTIYQEGIPFEARVMKALQTIRPTSVNTGRHTSRVLVSGKAVLQEQPDTATVYLAVVTQGKRALDAQQENAAKTATVLRAIRGSIGTGAEISTSGYAVTPIRAYNQGSPPAITGYEVRNRIAVVLADLAKISTVLDAAEQAGANDVPGISFSLRQDARARERALSEATRQAINKAGAVAKTLGGRMTSIVEVREGGPAPIPIRMIDSLSQRTASASTPTPIEVGSLDIASEVQVEAEIEIP